MSNKNSLIFFLKKKIERIPDYDSTRVTYNSKIIKIFPHVKTNTIVAARMGVIYGGHIIEIK
jgi:hypothetical protein